MNWVKFFESLQFDTGFKAFLLLLSISLPGTLIFLHFFPEYFHAFEFPRLILAIFGISSSFLVVSFFIGSTVTVLAQKSHKKIDDLMYTEPALSLEISFLVGAQVGLVIVILVLAIFFLFDISNFKCFIWICLFLMILYSILMYIGLRAELDRVVAKLDEESKLEEEHEVEKNRLKKQLEWIKVRIAKKETQIADQMQYKFFRSQVMKKNLLDKLSEEKALLQSQADEVQANLKRLGQ